MKALGLLSGGLDSQLAIRLMLEQGIEMTAVHFRTIFCTCPSTVSSGRSNRTPKGCGKSTAEKSALQLGIPFKEIHTTKEFLDIVRNPNHGYGAGMNPCIDCRILMLKKSKQYMREIGASFIITGEVLGQRPMSQYRSAMELIEKESGLKGLIVRPLSAKLLPPSIPELNGWVDRNKLLSHKGRSRKVQIGLAGYFGMKDYPCAAGGCLLTDPSFSRRMKESFEHKEDTLNDVQLLMIGRQFRLLNKVKLVVGRNEIENKRIVSLARSGDVLIEPVNTPGPSSLLMAGKCDNICDFLDTAMNICAGYCDGNTEVVLVFGRKDASGITWDNPVHINKPQKRVSSNDYYRRI